MGCLYVKMSVLMVWWRVTVADLALYYTRVNKELFWKEIVVGNDKQGLTLIDIFSYICLVGCLNRLS